MNDADYYKRKLEDLERERKQEVHEKINMGKFMMGFCIFLYIASFINPDRHEATTLNIVGSYGFIVSLLYWVHHKLG